MLDTTSIIDPSYARFNSIKLNSINLLKHIGCVPDGRESNIYEIQSLSLHISSQFI